MAVVTCPFDAPPEAPLTKLPKCEPATCPVPTVMAGRTPTDCEGRKTGDLGGCTIYCDDGYYIDSGTTGPKLCTADPGLPTSSYKIQPICMACPEAKYTNDAVDHDECNAEQTACSLCPAGKSATDGMAACVDCTPGYYAETEGMAACPACAPGYIQPNTAAKDCVACGVGKRQPNWANTVCYDCSPGKFQDAEAMTYCDACVSGTVQPATGTTMCNDCDIGYYQGAYQQTTCPAGAPGSYAPATASMTSTRRATTSLTLTATASSTASSTTTCASRASAPPRWAARRSSPRLSSTSVPRPLDEAPDSSCRRCHHHRHHQRRCSVPFGMKNPEIF